MTIHNKIQLFLDADDVLLRSSEAVINILNKRYEGLGATLSDVVSWNYTSICPDMNAQKVLELYESEEFWDTVVFDPKALGFLRDFADQIGIVVVSKGTKLNLLKKQEFLKKMLGDIPFEFIGLPLEVHETCFDKSCVNMQTPTGLTIQVDDRTDCLVGTNATLKILLKNHLERPWNKYKGGEPNLYIASSWEDVIDIIKFYLDNKDLLLEVSCNA